MVQRLSLLQNVGRFDNVAAGAALPFAPLTVIYAENARGKSTLATVMRSLGADRADLILERARIGAQHPPRVVIDTAAGQAVFQNGAWSRLEPDIVVFDDVFIAENVCSGIEIEGRHRQKLHELVIGAPGVALNAALKGYVDQIEVHNRLIRERGEAIPVAQRHGQELDAFVALQPVANIAVQIEAAERRVTAARSATRIAEAQVFQALRLPTIDVAAINLALSTALPGVEAAALDKVQAHLAELGRGGEAWVSEGTGFVARLEGRGKSDCPFCAQDLQHSPVIDHYRHYFGEAYAAHKEAIAAAEKQFATAHSSDVQTAFERSARFAAEGAQFWTQVAQVPEFKLDTAQVARCWKIAREGVEAAFKAKRAAPLEPGALDASVVDAIRQHNINCSAIELTSDELTATNPQLAIVKEQVEGANLAALTADVQRLKAIQARAEPAIDALCAAYLAEKTAKIATEQSRDAARAALDAHRQRVFPAYEAAINTYLQRFNASFRIGPVAGVNHRGGASVTYTLMVDGQAVPLVADGASPSFRNTLSAGDRNTLALAFFFASLENDPNRANKIVVIDDPMTSLDEHRSLHTRQEIDRLARDVRSMVVLSHSKPFLLGVWEQCRQLAKTSIELRRDMGGSTIAAWDVTGDMINEHDKRFARTVAYMGQADPSIERIVAEGLRPMLESYCRVAYSNDFPPGTLLGRFLDTVARRQGTANPIMSVSAATELRALLDFANRYHHDTNAGYATELINDAELSDFSRRTLSFIQRP